MTTYAGGKDAIDVKSSQEAATLTRSEPTQLLWVDCEMTGLDLKKDVIIEYAAIVTDGDLNELDEGVQWVIRTEKELLDGMDEWCTDQHGSVKKLFLLLIRMARKSVLCNHALRLRQSGLTEQCLKSQWTMGAVDTMALSYARKHIPHGRILLAGSSVHVDKNFLKKDFPALSRHLHYRVLDVSSVKEICRRWYPNMQAMWKSQGESSHRALDDIRASIRELRRYREFVFKDPKDVQPSPGTAEDTPDQPSEDVALSTVVEEEKNL